MANILTLFALLLITWLILSGIFNVFFISLGVISCLAAAILTVKMYPEKMTEKSLLRLIGKSVIYSGWLIKEICKSGLDVALRVWQLDPKISPVIAWVPTRIFDEISLTIYANSITLTPGTVSIVVREGLIQVHALDDGGIKDLRKGAMEKQVIKIC